MDRVGGYLDLLALEENAQRYEELLLVLEAEADAARMLEVERAARQRANRRP